jgi:hypothetical protein
VQQKETQENGLERTWYKTVAYTVWRWAFVETVMNIRTVFGASEITEISLPSTQVLH